MKFEKEKVITILDADKANVGEYYFRSNNLLNLKEHVEEDDYLFTDELEKVDVNDVEPFKMKSGLVDKYMFIYPLL